MTTKKTNTAPPAEPAPKAPDAITPAEAPILLDVGFDPNAILRGRPEDILVTYALLENPGPHLGLARHGYLEVGGGLYYRPTGFDTTHAAVTCVRVDN